MRLPAVALAQAEQLVDLFLIFGDGNIRVAELAVVDEFGRRNVRVDRRWEGTQRHRAEHRLVKAKPVVADHHDRVARLYTEALEAGGDGQNVGEQSHPIVFDPDAAVALAR